MEILVYYSINHNSFVTIYSDLPLSAYKKIGKVDKHYRFYLQIIETSYDHKSIVKLKIAKFKKYSKKNIGRTLVKFGNRLLK